MHIRNQQSGNFPWRHRIVLERRHDTAEGVVDLVTVIAQKKSCLVDHLLDRESGAHACAAVKQHRHLLVLPQLHRLKHRIGTIAAFFHVIQNPFAEFIRNREILAASVQDAANGGGRNSQIPRHILQSHVISRFC